jgi:hypothetical protein
MVATHDEAAIAAASVEDARRALAAVPDGTIPQVDSIRDAMSTRVEQYGPLLDTYLDVSERLPAILGWDRPRRYLVLSQDPAELRPTGGLIGSFGIVVFDKGRISELRFADVDTLDFPWDFPRIEPPRDLAEHVLDPAEPWQLADAGWSPDYPTSARDALRLYTNESGDATIDGVLGITTYTIDELLKVTGPVTVPGYAATIGTGETTLKVLQLTREAPSPDESRKAFLAALADRLIDSLLALPPSAWAGLIDSADAMRRDHLLQAWFRDAADQELAAATGFDGAVQGGAGDYLYPVDANVAPASKLNLVTTRSLDLDVQLDGLGNARDTLDVTWHNDVEAPGNAAYRAMVNAGGPVLGMYFRLLVPRGSRVESVAGGGPTPVAAPAVQDEAGRTAIGSYLTIPPGRTTLRYAWTSPVAAVVDATGGVYRLTIQKQPGARPGPLSVTIRVPEGYRITAASPELTVSGGVATMTGMPDGDVIVSLRYAP